MLWGSAHVKAACKILMKLRPDLFLRHGLREIVDDEVGAGSLVWEVAAHGWLTTSCRRRQHLHPVLHNCAGLPKSWRIFQSYSFVCCGNSFFFVDLKKEMKCLCFNNIIIIMYKPYECQFYWQFTNSWWRPRVNTVGQYHQHIYVQLLRVEITKV